MTEFLHGHIVRILDDQRLVINLGMEQGVSVGDHFFIYEEGDEISDPQTGESLGRLELLKAEVEAVHVQEKITLVSPLKKDQPQKQTVLSATLAQVYQSDTVGADKQRGHLNVRQNQITGLYQASPITVGDAVRSAKSWESQQDSV